MQSRAVRAGRLVALTLLLAGIVSAPAAAFPGGAASGQGSGGLASEAEVLETMNAGGYTYVRVRTEQGEIWAAGPQTTVAVGQQVNLGSGMSMGQFHSESLDRTFDQIYFVGAIEVVGEPALPAGHGSSAAPTQVEAGAVAKAEGGSTIAELYGRRGELAGKQVTVRGRVVKYTAGVMGYNWLHIQDGTGEQGTNDLTVTTDATAKVGDVVLVRGTAAIDKDFGAGYSYELIVEQATVEVE
jgi:hypothetical protein